MNMSYGASLGGIFLSVYSNAWRRFLILTLMCVWPAFPEEAGRGLGGGQVAWGRPMMGSETGISGDEGAGTSLPVGLEGIRVNEHGLPIDAIATLAGLFEDKLPLDAGVEASKLRSSGSRVVPGSGPPPPVYHCPVASCIRSRERTGIGWSTFAGVIAHVDLYLGGELRAVCSQTGFQSALALEFSRRRKEGDKSEMIAWE